MTQFFAFPSPCGVWVVSIDLWTNIPFAWFPSPCGVWVVSTRCSGTTSPGTSFRPLAGCGLFPYCYQPLSEHCGFPSPCGLWVVSCRYQIKPVYKIEVSVPLRGVGCFARSAATQTDDLVSVPLRGVGCFAMARLRRLIAVVSVPLRGVGCFDAVKSLIREALNSFRPLAGCGLFRSSPSCLFGQSSFRPLAGCGLFPLMRKSDAEIIVSVPLRGVGCFLAVAIIQVGVQGFRPLAGCGSFHSRREVK